MAYVYACNISDDANRGKLEWVRQLSQDPKNFIIAAVRNPDTATLLKPLLSSRVVSIQGDVADIDSFPVGFAILIHGRGIG